MKGWTDTRPDTGVAPAEYRRLLGYPPEHETGAKSVALESGARVWYVKHGRPWVTARLIENLEITADGISIQGISFTSSRLRRTLREAKAHAVFLVAASAGPELEAEANRLWKREHPDEYFFMETYGSAVVEHLITGAGARLCAEADEQGMAILPHDSPGYPGWSISEQDLLLSLMRHDANGHDMGRLDVLPSGMLRPKKSLLAVFGLTRHTDRIRSARGLSPCANCSYAPCQFRRAPYQHETGFDPVNVTDRLPRREHPIPARGLDRNGSYGVSAKALRRWSQDRMVLADQADGGIEATFRYEGTTCSNLGRPLSFVYRVSLSAREDGYVIRSQTCAPTPDDQGHRHMCQYLQQEGMLLKTIAAESPLLGKPLNAVLEWPYSKSPAGCFCEPTSREHKWGLALETLHFALVEREKLQEDNLLGVDSP